MPFLLERMTDGQAFSQKQMKLTSDLKKKTKQTQLTRFLVHEKNLSFHMKIKILENLYPL